MRIFDNPNHPQYGPIRRMWVVLTQLDLLAAAERWGYHNQVDWDQHLANVLAVHKQRESRAQRDFIYVLMEGWV